MLVKPLTVSKNKTYLPYPVVGKPRCFIRFLTSSESSCLSDLLYRLNLCWLIHSAVLLVCLFPFLLSLRAHCMLLRRSKGCSDWSLEQEFLWWLVLIFQCSLTSFVSSQSSTLIEICDWKSQQYIRGCTKYLPVENTLNTWLHWSWLCPAACRTRYSLGQCISVISYPFLKRDSTLVYPFTPTAK